VIIAINVPRGRGFLTSRKARAERPPTFEVLSFGVTLVPQITQLRPAWTLAVNQLLLPNEACHLVGSRMDFGGRMFRKELALYILIYLHYVLRRDPSFDFELDGSS
jgi:hypothetical protein